MRQQVTLPPRAGVLQLTIAEAEGLSDRVAETLRSLSLDFMIDFVGITCTNFIARRGLWRFFFRTPVAFWETLRRQSTVTVEMRAQVGDQSLIIRQGRFKTVMGSYSRVVDYILQNIATWPSVAARSWCPLGSFSSSRPTVDSNIDTVPSALAWLLVAVISSLNAGWMRWLRLFSHEVWAIGLVDEPLLPGRVLGKVQWIKNPPGRFWADPFGVEYDGKLYVLCEEFDYISDRGVVTAISFDKSLKVQRREVVLRSTAHMSYPFIVQHDGEIYCIPETYQARCVSLYRASEFPWHWVFVGNIIDEFAAVDSTLIFWQGRWWLFCSNQEMGPNDKLFVFYSTDLTTGWHAHSQNPVKIDVESSRPAGMPFVFDGHLYRPAQDCSKTYGGRVVLNKVELLTPHEFREAPSWVFEPDIEGPYSKGLHTVSRINGMYVIDGKRFRFLPAGLRRAVLQAIQIRTKRRPSSSCDFFNPSGRERPKTYPRRDAQLP
jgi:hypothetical protein